MEGSAYPAVWGLNSPYARAEGRAEGVLQLPGMRSTALAARAGGSAAFGEYPFFDAAFVGGWDSLRGYRIQRYAGDSAFFAGAEISAPLTTAELIVRGELGVSLFADAGRVFVEGESPEGWHGATGASLWFATPVGTLAASYARGEENRFYLWIGAAR